MNITQREKDKALLTKIWYMLRDYGDITNTAADEGRWENVINAADDVARDDKFAHCMMAEILFELECRSRGFRPRRDLPEDEKKLLRMYRRLSDKRKQALIDFMFLMN